MQEVLPAVVDGINASPTEALGGTAPDKLKEDPIAVFRQLQRNSEPQAKARRHARHHNPPAMRLQSM